jgi:hypothetical protein
MPSDPATRVAAHHVVATLVAKARGSLNRRISVRRFHAILPDVLRQQAIEISLSAPEPGTGLDLALIAERPVAGTHHATHRIARQIELVSQHLDRLAPDEVLAPYPADRLHNQHPRYLPNYKAAANRPRFRESIGRRYPAAAVSRCRGRNQRPPGEPGGAWTRQDAPGSLRGRQPP